MRPKFSKKLFPFSPGIPWTVKNNKYILPNVDAKIWQRALGGKDFIISCYGGFLESFFSLSYCEAIAATDPFREIMWMGNPTFEPLVSMQGIAKVAPFDLGSDIVDKYPVPIFMDAENHAYFNVMNDYLKTKSFKSKDFIINNQHCLEQVYKNCPITWDSYVPKIRSDERMKYKLWKRDNKFYDNAKYIVIFPKPWQSMHEEDCLGWNDRQVKEFASMVRHKGISVVACGFGNRDYYDSSGVISAPLDIEIMMGLIQNSWGVLSADIDNLLVTMAVSDSSIIMSREPSEIYELYSAAEFLDAQNVIFTDRDMLPRDVYQFLEGIV